jgi:hypothetical protein
MTLLRRLSAVNPTTAFLVALVLLLGGMFLPGIVGGLLLFLLFLATAGLTLTTWRVQSAPVRTIRVIMLALLLGAAVSKAVM